MTLQLQLTYQVWLKPGVGALWDPSDGVTVKSPMLFPTESATETLKVAGYSYQQDANAGTTTTLDLINTLAWEQRKGDATKNDGFYDLGDLGIRMNCEGVPRTHSYGGQKQREPAVPIRGCGRHKKEAQVVLNKLFRVYSPDSLP